MKRANLLCCISALVLTFAAASCSSDEVTNKGGTQGQPGSKVAFSTKVSLDGNTKKVYLGGVDGSNIQVWWGNNDQVKIYTTGADGGEKMGVYKTSSTQSGASDAPLEYVSDTELAWLASGSQSFYSVLAPEDDEGVTYGSIDASGNKTLIIPAVQTGAVASASGSSPYAVAFGSKTVPDVTAGGTVTLDYELVPGIIRLTIPAGDQINKITLHSAGVPLSGTISNYTGSAATADVTDVTNSGTITVNKTINSGGTSGQGTTPVDVYILPKALTYLAITVSGPTGSCTKTVSTDISAGQVTDVSFGNSYTMRKMDLGLRVISSVDQATGAVTTLWAGTADDIATFGMNASGITGAGVTTPISNVGNGKTYADAKPLYFATGNLIATMGSGNTNPATAYRIANQAAGDYLANMNSQTAMSSTDPERDLFKLGKIESDANYWAIDNNYPDMGSYSAGQTFAGDPVYDIARYAVGGNSKTGTWRLPTHVEWSRLYIKQLSPNNYSTNWRAASHANGAILPDGTTLSGVSGMLFFGVTDATKDNWIFIPATGSCYGTTVSDRGSSGRVWSCTLINSDAFSRCFNFISGSWSMSSLNRMFMLSVRPVSE